MCFQLQSKIANCKSCHLKIIFRHVVCNASFGRKLQLFLLTCVPHFVLSPIEHLLSSHEDLTSNNCKLLIINFETLHYASFLQFPFEVFAALWFPYFGICQNCGIWFSSWGHAQWGQGIEYEHTSRILLMRKLGSLLLLWPSRLVHVQNQAWFFQDQC